MLYPLSYGGLAQPGYRHSAPLRSPEAARPVGPTFGEDTPACRHSNVGPTGPEGVRQSSSRPSSLSSSALSSRSSASSSRSSASSSGPSDLSRSFETTL